MRFQPISKVLITGSFFCEQNYSGSAHHQCGLLKYSINIHIIVVKLTFQRHYRFIQNMS